MGVQADSVTRKWRQACHAQQNRLLASAPPPKKRAKKRFYKFAQLHLGMTADEFHAANFDLVTARRVTDFLTRIAWIDIDNWFRETYRDDPMQPN
jgi:hypothetical protein